MTTMETTQTQINPDEYNGWTNRESWALALHLSNDYDLYQEALAYAEVTQMDRMEVADLHGADTPDLESYATFRAEDRFKNWVEELFDRFWEDPESYENLAGMVRDVGSLWRIDWKSVHASFIE